MARPTGVTILAILSFLGAALAALVALGALFGAAVLTSMMSLPKEVVGIGVAVVAVICLGFAALYIANGIGLLKVQNWARILTIVLVILGLLSAALGILNGLAHFRMLHVVREIVVAGIDVLILWYLFKPEIKTAFGAAGSAA